MPRFYDPTRSNNFIDSMILNAVAEGNDPAVNEIMRMMNEDDVPVLLPYSVLAEATRSSTPPRVRAATAEFLQTLEVPLTQPERVQFSRLLLGVAGNATPRRIASDLFHVCEAAKYGSAISLPPTWFASAYALR